MSEKHSGASAPATVQSAIVIGHPKAARSAVPALVELLGGAGVHATAVETTEDAPTRLVTADTEQRPCVLVDVDDVATDVALAAMRVASVHETLHHFAPIAVAT